MAIGTFLLLPGKFPRPVVPGNWDTYVQLPDVDVFIATGYTVWQISKFALTDPSIYEVVPGASSGFPGTLSTTHTITRDGLAYAYFDITTATVAMHGATAPPVQVQVLRAFTINDALVSEVSPGQWTVAPTRLFDSSAWRVNQIDIGLHTPHYRVYIERNGALYAYIDLPSGGIFYTPSPAYHVPTISAPPVVVFATGKTIVNSWITIDDPIIANAQKLPAKCVCGADTCKHPVHSPWCDKAIKPITR